MKINNVPGIVGAYQVNANRKVTKGTDVSRAEKSDGVLLSREAQEVRNLKDKLTQTPEVRRERIENLRKQIEAGTYRPSGRDIAARMLKARVFDDLA